ncbi:uncharacterized protein [Littorina saxatilis]|uniref:uncharacterized protein n=1 Tax=Littorina saxatilis TaxID=31220 RepID=UPI0038B54569
MQNDCVIAADSRFVTGLERKIVAWIQPAHHDSLSVHYDRVMAFSRTSGQLITITTPRGPEQATVQNPRSLLEKIKGCASYEEIEEIFLQLVREHITEDITCEVDSVLQLNILQNIGEEEVKHPIFLDFRQGFGTVERVEGILPQRCAGVFTFHADDLPTLLGTDGMQVMQLFTQGRIKAKVDNSAALLRFHEFAKQAFGML